LLDSLLQEIYVQIVKSIPNKSKDECHLRLSI